MRAEYKRDMNHNYLILQGDQEVDTSSYQVRMLAGNVLPSILKCRLQGLDGKILFYYEITSRQSIVSLYEQKKFGIEDLRLIFGGFLQAMEEMGEYLLNPGQLLLDPEYVYMDVEKKSLQFCYLPGYEREVREQFQAFTEYILPKLDHEDGRAVMLGYSVYRSALEECFHLEHIKQVMYQEKEEELPKVPVQEMSFQEKEEKNTDFQEDFVWNREETDIGKHDDGKAENSIKAVKRKKTGGKTVLIAGTILAVSGLTGILTANFLGYLPWLSVEITMGTGVVLLGIGVSAYLLAGRKKRKEEKYWRKEVQENRKRKITEEECINQGKKQEIIEEGCINQGQTHKFMKEDSKAQWSGASGEIISGAAGKMSSADFGETVVLSANVMSGPSSLVSREPGELATIYLKEDITIIGKLETACDAVIPLPTVSRIHCKIRKREDGYYLTDLNSRNGTSINGIMLKGAEEYLLHNEDEIDFAQARYIFME